MEFIAGFSAGLGAIALYYLVLIVRALETIAKEMQRNKATVSPRLPFDAQDISYR